MVNEEIIDTMVRKAMDTANNAYAENGSMVVGACVLAGDGTLYGGCSIDNASRAIFATAEEVALYKAISEGKREFDAIAIIADTERPYVPCGRSLQIMAEFGVYEIIMSNMNGEVEVVRLDEFFPSGVQLLENHRYKAVEE